MHLGLWIAVVLALLLATLLVSISMAGRFAKLKRGAPSVVIGPGEDAPLDLLLAPLEAARPGLSGARLVPGETEALALRLDLARLAGRSLDLLYYIWDDDLSGRLLAQAVLEAADRGVRVRMLLDDVNVLNRDPVYRALDRHPRIEVRLFNPVRNRDRGFSRGLELALNLLPYNRRMHGKLWIADGRLAVTGGRNVGDAYFGALAGRGEAKARDFDDLDALLAGPVLREAEALFDRFWNSGLALPIRTLWPGKETRLQRFRVRLSAYLRQPEVRDWLVGKGLVEASGEPARDDAALGLAALRWSAGLAFLGDPPEKTLGRGREGWLPRALLPPLLSAQRELRIMTPYFVPGMEGMANLKALRKAGVRVEVITNGLALADNVLVYGAYRWYRTRLLAAGVAFHEIAATEEPRRMLHGKACVIDGTTGFVGSFNFDLRSVFLNTELGLCFEDPALVADLAAIFDAAITPDRAYRVAQKGRFPVWARGRAGETALEPESTRAKRALAWVIGHLPIHRFL